jgi:hypothetical protein
VSFASMCLVVEWTACRPHSFRRVLFLVTVEGPLLHKLGIALRALVWLHGGITTYEARRQHAQIQ